METEYSNLDESKTSKPTTAPDNYMVWAILTTILCCLPFGIVSIVKASEVNTKWAQNDYIGAEAASKAAKKWAIWSAVSAGIIWILYIAIFVLLGVGGAMMNLQYQ